MILDYDDLFLMFSELLPSNKIPIQETRIPLSKAKIFIFIGFHFTRWYTQMFLRYLNQIEVQYKRKENYILKSSFSNNEMQQFFLKQFKATIVGADWAFFEELHRRFVEKYPELKRKTIESSSSIATQISVLVENANFSKTFALLEAQAQLDSDDKSSLIELKSRFSQYQLDKKGGTVLQNDLNVELAQIRVGILELAKKIN